MDTRFSGFKFDDENVYASPDHSQHILNVFNFEDTAPNLKFMDPVTFDPFPALSPGDGSSDSELSSDTFLNFVKQTLMEEDLGEKSCMFHDPLALQAAEKSFYEILGQKHPLFPNQPPLHSERPDKNSSHLSPSTSNSVDPCTIKSNPTEYMFRSTSQLSYVSVNGNGLVDPTSTGSLLGSNVFSDPESVLQFNRGVAEARKFLPGQVLQFVIKVENDEKEYSSNASRGRKNREHKDAELEAERSNKQSALYTEEEDELTELFDQVLLCNEGKDYSLLCSGDGSLQNVEANNLQKNGSSQRSSGVKSRARRQSNRTEVVDLDTLLIHCAQATSADDRRTTNELLKKIWRHSSPYGDGSQRLTHHFANSLEARMAGTGTQLYTALAPKKAPASAILQAYYLYLSSCPFQKISMFYANHMIMELAEKASKLHIIDFGIQYGFQWPILIQHLSKRHGGPPKIRITGIELPQPGFRPAERLEETGRRLKNYCNRFKVPFEFNPIAQKWESIRVENLKIVKDEMLVVNCLFRFKNLLDESVVEHSPRNTVLNLIREINPNMFVHGVVNGSYNAPFFVTRFREALFHFSSLFDMLESIIPRDQPERLLYEREFVGREIMSVIACEGSERVERPETYKQWQVRIMRAWFRQLPLNRELLKKLSTKVRAHYHPNFMINEDGGWLLQGWKGRVLYGISCWIPT